MQSSQLSGRQRFNVGFVAGLAAGLVATGLMLLMSVTLGGISLPEVFGSALTQLMPPSLFNFLHQLIGGDAKHYLFYCILVGQCLVFAVCGGLGALLFGSARFAMRISVVACRLRVPSTDGCWYLRRSVGDRSCQLDAEPCRSGGSLWPVVCRDSELAYAQTLAEARDRNG